MCSEISLVLSATARHAVDLFFSFRLNPSMSPCTLSWFTYFLSASGAEFVRNRRGVVRPIASIGDFLRNVLVGRLFKLSSLSIVCAILQLLGPLRLLRSLYCPRIVGRRRDDVSLLLLRAVSLCLFFSLFYFGLFRVSVDCRTRAAPVRAETLRPAV